MANCCEKVSHDQSEKTSLQSLLACSLNDNASIVVGEVAKMLPIQGSLWGSRTLGSQTIDF